MKKLNIVLTIFAMIVFSSFSTISNASIDLNMIDTNKATKDDIINIIKNNVSETEEKVSVDEALTIYNEITDKYSHEELADMIEENKNEISKELNIKETDIEKGANILRNTDEDSLKEIINNDLNLDAIKEKIDNGEEVDNIIEEYFTPENVAKVGVKLLWANKIVKQILYGIIIYVVFKIIIRWRIFSKAKKHRWAAIVPIYNEVIYFKVCKMSTWFILLNLIPILGNIAYVIVKIVSKFKLSNAFGKGFLFGLGLWLLNPIFELILAIEKNTYIEE